MHVIYDFRILVQELLETYGGNLFNLLIEDLIDGVASVLKHVYEIHHLFLSQLQVRDFIIEQ